MIKSDIEQRAAELARVGKGETTVKKSLQFERRARVARLFLSGITSPREIAGIVGVSLGTVGTDLAWLRKQWAECAIGAMNESLHIELARLSRIEREAWAAYERSQADSVTTTVERTATPEGEKTVARTQKTNRDGDVKHLSLIRATISDRCRLLGVAAPERLEVTHKTPAGPVIVIPGVDQTFHLMSDEELGYALQALPATAEDSDPEATA